MTSAALILMFAFLVLSTAPGYEVKALAIGLAAGIIFDATVIGAMLVPALMKLFGDATGGCRGGWAPCSESGRRSRRRRSRSRLRCPPPGRGRGRVDGVVPTPLAEPEFSGAYLQLVSSSNAELGVDVRKVGLHGPSADHQPVCDRLRAEPACREASHFELSCGQCEAPESRGRPAAVLAQRGEVRQDSRERPAGLKAS